MRNDNRRRSDLLTISKLFTLTALIVALFACAACAAEKTIAGLGTNGINKPSESGGGWSYVYYGNYKDNPVLYRVLTPSTTDFGGKTMLLDCDSILEYVQFKKDATIEPGKPKPNEWTHSDVKKWLNEEEDGFLKKSGNFTTAEEAAIALSKKDAPAGGPTYNLTHTGLSTDGDTVFLLDVTEVTNAAYGYANNDTRVKKLNGERGYWWLRSPDSDDGLGVGRVNYDGKVHDRYAILNNVGVSPAFNVNLSSVIFSSLIKGTSDEYKLTLEDNSIGLNVGKITRDKDKITVT